MSKARTIMFQGTASHVGKSILTAALCRSLARRGYRVAPFKAQNMSLNSCVTFDGGEIGRSTAFQARAAGIVPTVDMNPVLLKPSSEMGAQVIVRGHPVATMITRQYHTFQPTALAAITESLDRLRAAFDVVVLEGAGCPAEINLEGRDISNMRAAELADAPVILIGDIERGGVFASLYGTWALLPDHDRSRVAGMVINRMRGDPAMLGDGPRLLEARTGVPVLGVVPYLHDLLVDEEDAVALDSHRAGAPSASRQADVAILRLPHISNFTDFSPLAQTDGIRIRYVERAQSFGRPDFVLLPGTKNTVSDLAWLRQTGLAEKLLAFAGQSGRILGICGGYQMLGRRICDPHQVESDETSIAGLGLLDVETTFGIEKALRTVSGSGVAGWLNGCAVSGYEIHHGATIRGVAAAPLLRLGADDAAECDGSISANSRIAGTYLHGIFDTPASIAALCLELGIDATPPGCESPIDVFDRLADLIDSSLSIDALMAIAGLTDPTPSRFA